MSLKAKIDVYPLTSYVQTEATQGDGHGASNNNNNNSGSSSNNNNNPSNKSSVVRIKTPLEKLMTLKARFHDDRVAIRSVEGVLVVHMHRHPHVLLLKSAHHKSNRDATGSRQVAASSVAVASNESVSFRLPGGRCRRGEPEETCLLRKLGRHFLNEEKLSKATLDGSVMGGEASVDIGHAAAASNAVSYFRVGDVLSRWYRPHFTPLMYPYMPPHMPPDSEKEVRTMFLIHMEPSVELTMQPGVELVAVPLFDLYDNASKYGPMIASIPALLSRVQINSCNIDH